MPAEDIFRFRNKLKRFYPAAYAAAAFFCVIFSFPAEAGIVMTCGGDSLIKNIYIDGNLMRIDMAGNEHEGEGKLIFRRSDDKNILLIVDRTESSYYELTSEDMGEIREQIDEAVKMIKEFISEIPEDRREETEPIIRGLIPPEYMGLIDIADAEKRVVKDEENVKINSFISDRYSIYRNDNKISEAWFAKAEQFGLEPEDFSILRDFDEFLEIPAPGMVPGLLISEIGEDNCVPLRILEVGEDESRVPVLDVKEFSREDIPPAAFSVPDGFTKQEIEL